MWGANNLLIQNSAGTNVASLDDNGNIRLKGKCIFAVSCNNPTNDAFRFQDIFGNTKAYIDFVNGDLCVSDNPCPHHSDNCLPPSSSAILKNADGVDKIYIDLDGHLCFTGTLYESTTV